MLKPKPTRLLNSLTASVSVFLLALTVLASVVWLSHQHQQEAERFRITAQGQTHAALIQQTLDQALSANTLLTRMIQSRSAQLDDFAQTASVLLDTFPLISHLVLAPGGVVSQVYPLDGNEAAIGLDLLSHPQQRIVAQRAIDQRQTLITLPTELVQGGQALIVRTPVWQESGEFWGLSNTVLSLTSLLEASQLHRLEEQRLAYEWRQLEPDGQNPIRITGSTLPLPEDHLQITINTPVADWELRLAPAQGWVDPWKLTLELLLALLLALLLGTQTWQLLHAYRSRNRLRHQVHEKTRHLSQAHQDLKGILAAIPDLLFEVDLSGRIYTFHSPHTALELYPPEHCIGKRFQELLPPSAAQPCERAIQEAFSEGYSNGIQYSLRLKDKTHWFELSVACKPSSQGEPLFICLARDITQRKKAEEDQRVAAIAFEAQEGILVADAEQRIVRVNRAFEQITGYTQAEVLGQNPSLLKSGRHDADFYSQMYADLSERGYWQGEIINQRKNGDHYPEWLTITVVRDRAGEITHYVATLTDMTEQQAARERIYNLNYYDSLTQLPNRKLLGERLHQRLTTRQPPDTDEFFALLCIDLDQFKQFNDAMGHEVGDQLLQRAAKRLHALIRHDHSLGRLSGDEFALLTQPNHPSQDSAAQAAKQLAQQVMERLGQPYEIQHKNYFMTCSIGIALLKVGQHTHKEAFTQAELAMYQAKEAGRNRLCFYHTNMQQHANDRLTLQNQLRHALLDQSFLLYYQPQVNAQRQVTGAEALLRWHHPEQGIVSPGQFITLAEETGLIQPIGQWVLETACQQLALWQKNPALAQLTLSINVSAQQFEHPGFEALVRKTLADTGADPHYLQLELTESLLVNHPALVIKKMQQLKQLGILISLDDFGTGYSSLAYLGKLPLDELKIDQSFVQTLNQQATPLALTILSLGLSLGLKVTAEGVEREDQFALLQKAGCDSFQGFLTGRPMPLSPFEDFVATAAV